MTAIKPAKTGQPLIVFSHGNSFPASTYGVVTRQLQIRGYTVAAIEKLGHDPAYPVTSNWPHLVQQLADFTASQVKASGQAAFLVGHSLGGFLSLMCAALHPQLGGQAVRGVVLLDSPLIAGWRATALQTAKGTGLVSSVSPGAVSRRRKNAWPDASAVAAHFQSKKMFASWHPDALSDYVKHGTHNENGQRVLSFDRDVETRIYNSLPHNLGTIVKSHPLQCPVSFIGGLHSSEMKRVGMAMTQKITHGRITMLDGSHLFPLENPLATAAAIEAALLNMTR